MYIKDLKKKFVEAIQAVGPIMLIVFALSLTIAPIPSGIMLAFIAGGIMVMAGMMLFSLGAELSMEVMGGKLGGAVTKTKKLWFILLVGFLLGMIITIAEPDLQVLAQQIPSMNKLILIGAVGIGVGLFLVIAFLRMVLGFPIRTLLVLFYGIVIILSFFAPKNFQAIAYDAGGVTTGPMTVPFIMSFGVGIAAIRNDKHAADDSFGLVALCSVGPIIAVMLLSIIFQPAGIENTETWIQDIAETTELRNLFLEAFPEYFKELAISLLPCVAIFGIFQLFSLRLSKRTLKQIGIGLLYTYLGLVIFMTGVSAGFLPAGTYLGEVLAGLSYRWIIIPIGMIIGFCIVNAEPAIYVLMRQVEELTNGLIKGSTLRKTLCLSVSASVGLALLRVLTGLPIQYIVIPGYCVALVLSFFTPKIFTAIAFDSGGVASGPMTTTFLLPFAMGACMSVGGDITTDAFGVVAMVAMTPLIAIQVLGIIFARKEKQQAANAPLAGSLEAMDNFAIIEL